VIPVGPVVARETVDRLEAQIIGAHVLEAELALAETAQSAADVEPPD
jgi:hypothetical protein